MNTLFKTVTSSKTTILKSAPSESVLNFKSNIIESQSIHIKDLELLMLIGINEEEKNTLQRVIVNIVIEVFPNHDGKIDDINSVVSYVDIIELIKQEAIKQHIGLVETFAHNIINACFDNSLEIESVEVCIDKPDVIKETKSVGCSIKKIKV